MKFLSVCLFTMVLMMGQGFSQDLNLPYQQGYTALNGYLKKPASATKAPGVVVIHAWMGITAHEKNTVDKLAQAGYYALAADIYGADVHVNNTTEASKQAGIYKTDYLLYQARIKAAIDAIIQQGADPDNIVVMGYCFGGTGALEAARGQLPVKGVVSFHGGLGKDVYRANGAVNARVLVLHGADDPYVSADDIKNFQAEMREAKADWQMIYFANAVHAFTEVTAGNDNSKGAAYNKLADERSWQYMMMFLKELFGK